MAAKREQDLKTEEAVDIVRNLLANARFEPAAAKRTFETKCAQCHALPTVEEAKELVARMARNGLVATREEFAQVVFYLGTGADNRAAVPTKPRTAPAPGQSY